MKKFPSIEFDVMFKNEKTGYLKYVEETGELISQSYTDISPKCLWEKGTYLAKEDMLNILVERIWPEAQRYMKDQFKESGYTEMELYDRIIKGRGMVVNQLTWLRFPEDKENDLQLEDIWPHNWGEW